MNGVKAILLIFQLSVCASAALHVEQSSNNEIIEEQLKTIKGELANVQSQLNRQQLINKDQGDVNSRLEEKSQKQSQKINNLKQIVTSNPSKQYLQTDFGCFSHLITLWCFDGGAINVTDAYYGMYSTPCESSECCMPDQVDDCRVAVLDNRPSDWVGLKLTCDNRTSCSYEYLGSAIDECEPNYLADYMQIYYTCGTGSVVQYDPVGFSAYAEYIQSYNFYETIEFTGVISNIGNSYDQTNSSFECPYRGVYVFSLTVKSQSGYHVYLELHRDGEYIAQAMADDENYSHQSTAAATVVIECEAGQVVLVSSGSSSAYVHGSSSRQSIFTGYMLYAYE